MGLFGKKQEQAPKDEPTTVEQEIKEVDPATLCRACTHGIGDGLCSYHTNQWRRVIQRNEKIIK